MSKSYADLIKAAKDAKKTLDDAKAKADASQITLVKSREALFDAEEALQDALDALDVKEKAKLAADTAAADAIDKAADLGAKAIADPTLTKEAAIAQQASLDAQTARTDATAAAFTAKVTADDAEKKVADAKAEAEAQQLQHDAQKTTLEAAKKLLKEANGAVAKKRIPIFVGVGVVCLIGFLVTYFLMGDVKTKEPPQTQVNNKIPVKNKPAGKAPVAGVPNNTPTSTAPSVTPTTAPTTAPVVVPDQSDEIAALQQQINDLKDQLNKPANTTTQKAVVKPKTVANKPAAVSVTRQNTPKKSVQIAKVIKKETSRKPQTTVAPAIVAAPVTEKEDAALQEVYKDQWEDAEKMFD